MGEVLYHIEPTAALIFGRRLARMGIMRTSIPHLDGELVAVGEEPQADRITRLPGGFERISQEFLTNNSVSSIR
jgi:hypothetical protein